MFYKNVGHNTTGRDFVVADLHGSYTQLIERLHGVGFDPLKDRLFGAGDLIDRGLKSFECLQLLAQPWFFGVLGNHEAMLLTWANLRQSNYHSANDFMNNGGDWVLELSAEQTARLHSDLLPALLKLPLVIHVEDEVQPFNVLHAEAMGRTFEDMLGDADLARLDLRLYEVPLTWGRRLVREACHEARSADRVVQDVTVTRAPVHPGLSLTYVGHSILPAPVLHRSHLFMDCGAYRATLSGAGPGYLHLVEHRSLASVLHRAGVKFTPA